MKLPPPPGPHFSVDDLVDILSTTQALGAETEARLIHHFALLCPECGAALDELPPLDDCCPSSPTTGALSKMVTPAAAHLELTPNHRGAIAASRSRPLGFCHLLAEEAWWAVECNLKYGVVDFLRGFFGSILANGACLAAPREAHDLQAHLLALIAQAYSWAGDPIRAGEAVALAKLHLARGKGGPEPKASLLEVEAQLAPLKSKTATGWALLDEARRLLEGYEPADRQAEILLYRGIVTTRYREDTLWPRATAAFRQGLAILDRLEPGTNPALRLDLSHKLAAVEAELLFLNRIAGTDHEGLDAAAIEQMVTELEPLYKQYGGARKAAERAAMLGKVFVFTDLERAQAEFHHAMGQYWRVGNWDAATKLLWDLLYLWDKAVDCGISGRHVSFLAGLWDPPQDERFFCEVMAKFEAALAGCPPDAPLYGWIRQLRQAVQASSREAGRGHDEGAEK
jgi:hypothetical protein